MRVKIPKRLYDEVIAHCQREYPKEACGILAGRAATGTVDQIYPMTNVDASPISYAMDPREQLRVMKAMRGLNQEWVAVYHSHTATDAYPSPVDVTLAVSPDLAYLLVSLKDRQAPRMRNYRIEGRTITPQDLQVDALVGIMGPASAHAVDVRDMLCAQALAVVSQAVQALPQGEALRVQYNAQDVRHDLLVWACAQGHAVSEGQASTLTLVRHGSGAQGAAG